MSSEENVLYDLVYNERWDDAIARVRTEEGREELRRQGGECGWLPLHRACYYDAPLELVEAMVEAYPEAVRVADSNRYLPLHNACIGSDISPRVVRLILNAYPEGAKATNSIGSLPLHWAAEYNNPLEVMVMLIDAHPEGAAVRNQHGRLPLHCLACQASPDEKEDVEKVELLLRPLLDNEEACQVSNPAAGGTPLHIAAKFDVLSLHTCVQIPRCPVEVIVTVAQRHPGQAAALDGDGRFPLNLAIESGRKWREGVKAIADAAKLVITVKDETTGLFPFMLAAIGDDPCIDTVYNLFRRCPELKRYALD